MASIRVKLDIEFRKYLLNKAIRNGEGKIYCPISKKWLREDQLHVCHFIKREFIATRYSENNCILCDKYSNIFEDGIDTPTGTVHMDKFREVLGDSTLSQLNEIKYEKLSQKALENLLEKFKKFNDDIRRQN